MSTATAPRPTYTKPEARTGPPAGESDPRLLPAAAALYGAALAQRPGSLDEVLERRAVTEARAAVRLAKVLLEVLDTEAGR